MVNAVGQCQPRHHDKLNVCWLRDNNFLHQSETVLMDPTRSLDTLFDRENRANAGVNVKNYEIGTQ